MIRDCRPCAERRKRLAALSRRLVGAWSSALGDRRPVARDDRLRLEPRRKRPNRDPGSSP